MKFALLSATKKFLYPSHDRARHGLSHVCVCLALFCAWSVPAPDVFKIESAPARVRVSESELDSALQRAALGALGARDGTIIVMDAQTGRVRAAVNQRMANEAAFPPGSTIKPFTLLAALRARVINADARLSCRKHYARHGADFTCSHPVYTPPFNSAEALAHSCNYYFARLAERLPPDAFNATLAAYGFGAQTQVATITTASLNDVAATTIMTTPTPRIPHGRAELGTALGEGGELLVTPVQLVAAYAALFNGGHLYQLQAGVPENFRPREMAQPELSPAERTLLLSGLRGAVKYGTASPADLASLPTHVFGKTGTATELDGIHTHGWFVGFASERATEAAQEDTTAAAAHTGEEPAPAAVKLAVLVFLKRGQGKQCAELARPIFAKHARLMMSDVAPPVPQLNATSTADTDNFNPTLRASNGAPIIRVRLAREELTRTLSLDDYVFGVLAAEASVEDEFAALKAQAVVSRTYALANLHRHARDGYDLCNTTHCQRFLQVTEENARPDFHELVRRAVGNTSGEVLRDGRGVLASNVYFSTSCGGQTANIQTLWGTPARAPTLRGGVRDEYCAAMPHHHWTDAIPAARLALALRNDERTDVGARVEELAVVKRDATGRAEQIAITGERRRVVVRGWDFKIIVGRTLGWSVLKSSRFEVMRAGDKFVFRGSGFGHGLGLCQSGAHVMAARGASYRQILAHYFPATTIGGASLAERQRAVSTSPAEVHARSGALKFYKDAAAGNDKRRDAAPAHAAVTRSGIAAHDNNAHLSFAHASIAAPRRAPTATAARLTLSSANFRVSYPARGASVSRREVESALAALEAVRSDVGARLSAASLALPSLGVLEVTVYETTGDFTGATGKPAWVAATTRGSSRIETQPLATLNRRGILARTLRHEYTHAVINALSHGGRAAPLWLSEGLAAHVANEGARLLRFASQEKISLKDLEERLAGPASAADMRALYAAAFREVSALIRTEGEANVWRCVARG